MGPDEERQQKKLFFEIFSRLNGIFAWSFMYVVLKTVSSEFKVISAF